MAIDLTSSPFTAPDSCDNFAYGVLPSLTKKLFNELCSRLRYTISELEAFIATGDISIDGDDDTQHADPECYDTKDSEGNADNFIDDLTCISDTSGESLLSSDEESMFNMLLRDSPSPSPPITPIEDEYSPSESVTDHMRASLSTTSRLSPPSAAATHSSSLSTTEEEYNLLVRQFPEMFFMIDLSPVMTVQISRDSDTQNLEQEYHRCFRNKFRVHTTHGDSSTHSVHDCEYCIQDPSLPPSRTPSRVETEQHFKRRPTQGSRSEEVGKGLRIPVSSKQAKKHQHERRPRSSCKREFESSLLEKDESVLPFLKTFHTSRLPSPIMGTCPNKRIDDPRPCVFYPIYLAESPSSALYNGQSYGGYQPIQKLASVNQLPRSSYSSVRERDASSSFNPGFETLDRGVSTSKTSEDTRCAFLDIHNINNPSTSWNSNIPGYVSSPRSIPCRASSYISPQYAFPPLQQSPSQPLSLTPTSGLNKRKRSLATDNSEQGMSDGRRMRQKRI
ncbi:hypothetical protein BDN70DRAFT_938692 [Pholiota conissans]|uniref:Uncharacterized protein n=1 Tax=Pholiota conissans TaxID=109636 RepID=A0A9P5YM03_9AGAR|nr:hypothetical protein BDN70DRAFT_938692 [Pholiota conissans]